MPELPELEIIALLLTDELSGKSVKKTVVHNHIVVHGQPVSEFESLAVDEEFDSVRANGKFLVLSLTNVSSITSLNCGPAIDGQVIG